VVSSAATTLRLLLQSLLHFCHELLGRLGDLRNARSRNVEQVGRIHKLYRGKASEQVYTAASLQTIQKNTYLVN
jgi:hypothetical protein